MKFITPFILLSVYISCSTQKDAFKDLIYNIRTIEQMPEGREYLADSLLWVIVRQKLDIVPYLIEVLDDTTKTRAAVPGFGGYYTVADIAQEAISNIIHGFPTLELAEDSLYAEGRDGFWGYWKYVRRDYENRRKFKSRVWIWFNENRHNLEWVSYPPPPSDRKPTPYSHLEGFYRLKGSNIL